MQTASICLFIIPERGAAPLAANQPPAAASLLIKFHFELFSPAAEADGGGEPSSPDPPVGAEQKL